MAAADDAWSLATTLLRSWRNLPARPAQQSLRRSRREYLAWGAAAALGLVATAAWVVPRSTPAASPVPNRDLLSILPPPGATPSYAWEAPEVSPDGRHIAFASSDASGTVWLYVRSRDALEPRRLPGTEEANLPFWSPDSTRLGFFAAGQLKTIALDGSAPRVLAPAPVARGGAWGRMT